MGDPHAAHTACGSSTHSYAGNGHCQCSKVAMSMRLAWRTAAAMLRSAVGTYGLLPSRAASTTGADVETCSHGRSSSALPPSGSNAGTTSFTYELETWKSRSSEAGLTLPGREESESGDTLGRVPSTIYLSAPAEAAREGLNDGGRRGDVQPHHANSDFCFNAKVVKRETQTKH